MAEFTVERVPYKLGPTQAVKSAAQSTNLLPKVTRQSPDFLREAMADYLKSRDAIFNFMVRVQTDAAKIVVELENRALGFAIVA